MKRIFCVLALICLCLPAQADSFIFSTNVNMANYWQKTGLDVQKVQDVGYKVINSNSLNKYVVIRVIRNLNTANAEARFNDKSVNIYTGLLPYIDNDDELAYIIGHEIGHCLDFYDGFFRYLEVQINSKSYETKADLVGIDLMVKAGYNPVAAICAMDKISGESIWADYIFWSHPKGTVRMLNMYKYIYKKYPWALESEMTKSPTYQAFINSQKREIDEFIQEEKFRSKNRSENL